jgi:hypothetical protein
MKLLLKHVKETRWQASECINVVHDEEKWRAVVKTVMNLRVLYNAVNFLFSGGTTKVSKG